MSGKYYKNHARAFHLPNISPLSDRRKLFELLDTTAFGTD